MEDQRERGRRAENRTVQITEKSQTYQFSINKAALTQI